MAEMGGVGELFGSKGVSYTPAEIDPKTQQLINDSVTRAAAPTSEVADKLNQGVNQAGNQAMQSDQQMQQQAAQTGQDPSMLQAIRNQFNQSAGKGIQRIVNTNNNQAQLTKASWLQQAYQHSMAQQQVATQNYEALTQAYSNAQMARGQVLASIFSLGGTAGGMAMQQSRKGGFKDYGTSGPNMRADNMDSYGGYA